MTNKFKYLEIVKDDLSYRKKYEISKEVIKQPFKETGRFREQWRSIYLYKTNEPSESSALLGNFHLESDFQDFNKNKKAILKATDYLHKTYKIPYDYFDYFFTNKSIWLTIPSKVFNCYGSNKLNVIHKNMANEVDEYVRSKSENTLYFDLSIYKWNGLMHSLGSYLPKVKKWVTKFSYKDLEESYNPEMLRRVKYDNCFTYSDIDPVTEASDWYLQERKKIFTSNSKSLFKLDVVNEKFKCMENLKKIGFIEEDRNNHIYAYALYLKSKNKTVSEAIEIIQEIFSNNYTKTREALRTIESAILGTKNFNCIRTKEILNSDIFECDTCEKQKNTFIMPRSFVNLLNDHKVHHDVYRYLVEILYSKQILNKNYAKNLKGEKYKKNIIKKFKMLETLNLIELRIDNDLIKCKLIIKDKTVYKSYLTLPKNFIEILDQKKIKKEIKLLLELYRSSLLLENGLLMFNVKLKKLTKRIHSSKKTILKYIKKLRNSKLLFQNYITIFMSKNRIKNFIENIVNNLKTDYYINNVKNIFIEKIKELKISVNDTISLINKKLFITNNHIHQTWYYNLLDTYNSYVNNL